MVPLDTPTRDEAVYHWACIHETLRVSPAIALGLTNHVWSVAELIEAAQASPEPDPLPAVAWRPHRLRVIQVKKGRNCLIRTVPRVAYQAGNRHYSIIRLPFFPKDPKAVRMLDSIQFQNFKVLRNATLPLAPFTLTVGPNGSGKSTALQALQSLQRPDSQEFERIVTASLEVKDNTTVEIILQWNGSYDKVVTTESWIRGDSSPLRHQVNIQQGIRRGVTRQAGRKLNSLLNRIRVYSLDAPAIIQSTQLKPNAELSPNGGDLVGVMDSLRDKEPERFEALNKELGRWLPEFDRILFETPKTGHRAFLLRTRRGHHALPARDLSQGTVLALAILTLAYLPDPPPLIGIEEPERGVHPRLLRNIQTALYRLSYPKQFGEDRQPVQVIATTHSPYFLDLYKDHPEEIVIAQKTADGAEFKRLSDQPHIMEVLDDAPLGEVWYSGILGGVPAEQ